MVMTWMTPELAPLSPNYHTTQRENVSTLNRFNVHRCPTRRVFNWARTRDKASHDPIPIPLGYRGQIQEENTDFVQSIPGFQESGEDVETSIACHIQDWGFQVLNDDEIVTSVPEESDPVDDETDEDEDISNESSKGPSNAGAFSA
ncbi:uncharacterized protein TNCV_680991 [Trichonephila clavipes]|nr:uncharacterized protein TNCV_680991 [Trichonephila clavipes]